MSFIFFSLCLGPVFALYFCYEKLIFYLILKKGRMPSYFFLGLLRAYSEVTQMRERTYEEASENFAVDQE